MRRVFMTKFPCYCIDIVYIFQKDFSFPFMFTVAAIKCIKKLKN